jgi:hypothetical protein
MNNCKKECPLLSASLIPLSKGKWAIVDNDEYDWLSRLKWYVVNGKRCSYARRTVFDKYTKKTTYIYMHREIMGVAKGDKSQVDHVNHNSLDNRRVNMRRCSASENLRNQRRHIGSTSKYKGVSFAKGRNKWVANIVITGKQIYLGRFDVEEDAARAYNRAADKFFGEFAHVNKIGD